MVITSKYNPLIKEIAKLSDKKYRKICGKYVVEGIKPVRECISAGCTILNVICVEGLESEFENAVIVSRAVFESVSSEVTPQGVLAVAELPSNKLKVPQDSCILLDRLQDPGNLGTVIRTANAAGYSEIYLINCTDPYSPKAVRASMSGIFFVKVYQGTNEEILGVLKGIPLICADMDGEDIFSFNSPEKFCLCIGNEGNGMSQEIMKRARFKVSIPMRETCESLNAAVSAGIVMYHLKYDKKR